MEKVDINKNAENLSGAFGLAGILIGVWWKPAYRIGLRVAGARKPVGRLIWQS
jgi:hypothetical protein